jgi:hypothetical protein
MGDGTHGAVDANKNARLISQTGILSMMLMLIS